MSEKISVPIDSELIGQMFLRQGPKSDVSQLIERVVWDFMERTADEGGWDEAYYAYLEGEKATDDFVAKYGSPKEGYHWAPLFLPNGTKIRMEYKKETHYATVKFSKIEFNGKSYSASELARHIANNTNRNAWRDLLIKMPRDTEWSLADDLRRHLNLEIEKL